MLRQALDHSDLTDLIHSEEEELYVLKTFCYTMNELSTTNQDEQYQEIHCRGGEGFKTLIVLLLSPLLLRHGHGSRLIETLAIRATLDACPVPFV